MTHGKLIGLWLPVIAFMFAVIALADQEPGVVSFPVPDKLVHASAYAVLGVLTLRATHRGLSRPRIAPAVLAMVITLGFGAVDEWNQTRFSHRDASFGDWIADGVGAGLALVGVRIWGAGEARASRPAGPGA